MNDPQVRLCATLTCPSCGHRSVVEMPRTH
jgi:hypothetical protein